jgi:hypothetical protein
LDEWLIDPALDAWLREHEARRVTASRVGKVLLVTLVGCYVGAGVVASHRAYYPVGSVSIVVSRSPLHPNTTFRVDTVTSGRGPVNIRLECQQGERVALVATDDIPSKRWAYWDPRRVFHSTHARLGSAAAGFEPDPITLRATVTGAPAWLRQPPSVVQELSSRLEVGDAAEGK